MIEIQNINLYTKTKHILKNINLNINSGEKVALLGASGSGKSMLMQSILGILLEDMKLDGNIETNEKFGVILQNPSSCFFNTCTIKKHFLETFKAHNIKEYNYGLEYLNLDALVLEAYPFMLSGGTLQKIMISLALSINPSFILADEPTSNLDSATTKNLIDLILEQQENRRFGLLFITHDISLAKYIADRIIIIDNGEIIEQNAKTQIITTPQHNKTKELLNEDKKLAFIEKKEKTTNTHKLISVKNLKKSYTSGGFFNKAKINYVLDDISFDLFYKNNLGILGKNGAGKSTITKILLGLESYDSGEIEILNHNIKGNFPKELRKDIQSIFQDSSYINPKQSAIDSILEGLENFTHIQNREKKAEELLKLVKLDSSYMHKKNAYFSGGEQQRIALARILALEPKIIILDEAISSLDAHLQYKMIELFKNIQKEKNITFIVVSHDIRIILQLCNEVIILDNGKVSLKTSADNIEQIKEKLD
ncbi:ABC transporter ATP-binding protein [Helicobacter sp. WB40]|uniref:ABC transporter ATP-binding protein n=1 Tax=Helicobacter sp. WB40 TaxID=3004130 RepID=UPI0022EBB9B7|nr:ATP-binding cassette domain-containing protein [Helicobacter sp. WB40]MDA3967999.1 ATP-binding cassette domain-containing protein [Helicobacter sp. WB40]